MYVEKGLCLLWLGLFWYSTVQYSTSTASHKYILINLADVAFIVLYPNSNMTAMNLINLIISNLINVVTYRLDSPRLLQQRRGTTTLRIVSILQGCYNNNVGQQRYYSHFKIFRLASAWFVQQCKRKCEKAVEAAAAHIIQHGTAISRTSINLG